MNEKTEQMSLLDAIGFSAPEPPRKQTRPKTPKPSPSAEQAEEDTPASEAAETISTPETAPAEKAASARVEPSRAVENLLAPAPPPAAQAAKADQPSPSPVEQKQDNVAGDLDDAATSGTLPLDKYICFALYSANHAMHGVYKALLKEIGLTYPQFLAMTVLWETNNVPVGAITSKLQLDTNTLTPLLKRLEAMGLVTRTRNVKDERQVILKLTRKGRALQKKTEHFGQCIFGATGLEMDEAIELQQRIMKLRDNLRASGLE